MRTPASDPTICMVIGMFDGIGLAHVRNTCSVFVLRGYCIGKGLHGVC